jgi:hypothetical protein
MSSSTKGSVRLICALSRTAASYLLATCFGVSRSQSLFLILGDIDNNSSCDRVMLEPLSDLSKMDSIVFGFLISVTILYAGHFASSFGFAGGAPMFC